MPSEKELLERIRLLEEQNNELQDKLDAIYSILAPDYEPQDFDVQSFEQDEAQARDVLVNIEGFSGGKAS